MVDILELIGPLPSVSTPELRAIVVTAINGSTTINGTSGQLGNSTDTELLLALRRWSDVVLVGSSTVKAENYGGVKVSPEIQKQRLNQGQEAIPPIAVMSGSLNFDVDTRFFLEAEVPPIIITDNSDQTKQQRLVDAGAQVIEVETLTAEVGVEKLRSLGYARIDCEGGATLYGQMLAADLVDVWHHTIDPTLSGSVERPTVKGGDDAPRRFTLEHVFVDDDSTLFLRYKRAK
ncbi:MAG: pyrimidine reductase family protein [Corynebacterium glutamicum]|nr:pyrimidine reductase family protein [Corynebacterium glutamicum]